MGVQICYVQWQFLGEKTANYKGPAAVSCAKTAKPIEMPFGVMTRVGPRNQCVRWQCTLTQLDEYN